MERSKTQGTSSDRSFISRALPRRDRSGDYSDDGKGPLGLTTLFDPINTAVSDLVFVHGLDGGSRSTWTKSDSPSLFWPKEWLPQDPGFQNVRIHSFGYNSNWGNESILNVHDFAKALLRSLSDCPAMPRNSSVRCSSPLICMFWHPRPWRLGLMIT